MNPFDNLESEQTRIYENIHFFIENKECLGDHGSLHPMIAKKERYIPVNVYNKMKEIFIKIGKIVVCWYYIQVTTFLI